MPKRDARGMATVGGMTLLAAGEVPNFLAGMLPSLMTIGRFAADGSDRAKLRRGEVVGSVLSLGVAYGASMIAESWLPLIAASIVLVVLLWEYERAIRAAQSEGATPINAQ